MTTWSKVFQITRYKGLAYKAFATERLLATAQVGDTVKRTYPSTGRAKDMDGAGSYATRALTNTEESLTIGTKHEYSFTLVEWENYLRHMPDQQKYSEIASRELFRKIDADVLGALYSAAGSSIDEGDIGGTPGASITVSATNVADIFIAAGMKLRLKNAYFDPGMRYEGGVVQAGMPVAAISPQVYAKLISYLGGKTSVLGDAVSQNQFAGKFDIFNIFVSNNLPSTVVATMATDPSNTQTITINGVVLTFVTGTPTAAGEIKATGTVNTTRTKLVAFLANPRVSVAGDSVAVSQANADLLDGITAVNTSTSDTLTFTAIGWNSFALTTTVTGATVGSVTQQCIFGVSDSIDLVMKKQPGLTIKDTPSANVSKDFIHWDLYGRKVYADQAVGLVNVKILATGFTQPSQP